MAMETMMQGTAMQAGSAGVSKPRIPVMTIFGALDQKDLVYRVQTEDLPDQICISVEWYYVGQDPQYKAHVGYVRRDLWVNVKYGLSATGEQGV